MFLEVFFFEFLVEDKVRDSVCFFEKLREKERYWYFFFFFKKSYECERVKKEKVEKKEKSEDYKDSISSVRKDVS